MKNIVLNKKRLFSLLLGLSSMILVTPTFAVTVNFQEGVSGYAGTSDIFIEAADPNATHLGSVNAVDTVDGLAGHPGQEIDERQMLIRFDNIFGAGVGQIPAGSKILSASLDLTTANRVSGDGTSGPHGVAQLLVPFDSTTDWASLGGDGASLDDGDISRPLANGVGNTPAGTVGSFDVTSIVQNWLDGQTNNGLLLRPGRNDGWALETTSAPTPANRPKLTVDFDPNPAPQPGTATAIFRQGLGGYSGMTSAGFSNDGGGTGTSDTTSDPGDWLDNDGPLKSDAALLRFEDLFVSEGGTVPDGATIVSAQLLLTGSRAFSAADPGNTSSSGAPTKSTVNVSQMLQSWDPNTSWSSAFGDLLEPDVGVDVSAVLGSANNFVEDAQMVADVTSAVLAWQSGSDNNGFFVRPGGGDGWRMALAGYGEADGRPTLVVNYIPEPGTLLIGAAGMLATLLFRNPNTRQK